MKYKNIFNAHIEIGPHHILEPNGVVELTDEEVKAPLMQKLIYEKNWLAPLGQQVVTGLTDAELTRIENEITRTHPPTTENVNFNFNFPIGHNLKEKKVNDDKNLSNDAQKQYVQEAILRAKQQKEELVKYNSWNPMDDAFNSEADEAEEEANAYKHKYVNNKTEYGNSEYNQDLNPVTFSEGAFGTVMSLQELRDRSEKARVKLVESEKSEPENQEIQKLIQKKTSKNKSQSKKKDV